MSTFATRPTPISRRRRGLPSRFAGLGRAQIVWASFLVAMTTVGGLLLLLDPKPVPRTDGFSLTPLIAASEPSALESIFRTRATLDTERWKSIVIHHSGSPFGSATSIAADHEGRGFRGLGHHFLIGNGSGMPDGEVHVGYRWRDQLPGAHAAGEQGEWYNHHAISICLVGDGNRRSFTPAQVRALLQIVPQLCRELDIPRSRVLLHSDVAPTSDPGRLFPRGRLQEVLTTLP